MAPVKKRKEQNHFLSSDGEIQVYITEREKSPQKRKNYNSLLFIIVNYTLCLNETYI